MNEQEFSHAVAFLQEKRWVFPFYVHPGSFPGGWINVGEDKETWDAYEYNPPEYLRPGFLFRVGAWGAVDPYGTPPAEDPRFQHIWQAMVPGMPVAPEQPAPTGTMEIPEGWLLDDLELPAWSCRRRIRRVGDSGETEGHSDSDSDASPKPTYEELLAAADGYVVNSVQFVGKRFLRLFVEKQICEAVFGANNITHEMQIRDRLQNSGEVEELARANGHRDHWRGRYHEVMAWIDALPYSAEGKAKAEAWQAVAPVDLELTVDPAFMALFTGATWTPPGEAEPFDAYHLIPAYRDSVLEGMPPVELKLREVLRLASSIRYEVLVTAAATVKVTADNPAVVVPEPFITERAAKVEFDVMFSRGTSAFTITVATAPYGEAKTASLLGEGA